MQTSTLLAGAHKLAGDFSKFEADAMVVLNAYTEKQNKTTRNKLFDMFDDCSAILNLLKTFTDCGDYPLLAHATPKYKALAEKCGSPLSLTLS
jgi:hypothetical protein